MKVNQDCDKIKGDEFSFERLIFIKFTLVFYLITPIIKIIIKISLYKFSYKNFKCTVEKLFLNIKVAVFDLSGHILFFFF